MFMLGKILIQNSLFITLLTTCVPTMLSSLLGLMVGWGEGLVCFIHLHNEVINALLTAIVNYFAVLVKSVNDLYLISLAKR